MMYELCPSFLILMLCITEESCLLLVSEEATKKHPFPCPTTYRTALLHYLDITSCPRTNVLKDLAEYASNSDEKEFLLKLSKSTTEGKVCLKFAYAVILCTAIIVENIE